MKQFDQNLEEVLQNLESGKLLVDDVIHEIQEECPALFKYIFSEDHLFLTDIENEQFILSIVILWKLCTDPPYSEDESDFFELEEKVWPLHKLPEDEVITHLAEKYPFVNSNLVEVINDIADPDIDEQMTESGCDWLFAKGLTVAVILFNPNKNK